MKTTHDIARRLPLLLFAASCLAALGASAQRPSETDYDGDGKTDHAVYHASTGDWYIRQSATGTLLKQNWGWPESEPVPGDYDGDQQADICVFHSRSGTWYLLRSSDGSMEVTSGWGSPEVDPIIGDYDGDGLNDMTMYHPPTGDWYIQQSSDGQRLVANWGWWEAEPVPGDYDGDGKTDLAVYYRDIGYWYILESSNQTARIQNWGWSEAEPVQADYDGDHRTDLAVFHPPQGVWYILESSTSNLVVLTPGWYNAQPVPGYYDDDEKADVAVYHAQLGNWLWRRSSDGKNAIQNWGWVAAEPASSAYRIHDDAGYYDIFYEHDYDDDDFAADGKYPHTGEDPEPPPADLPTEVPADFNNVEWLHTDVSDWSETATLTVSLSSSKITLDYDKADVWPGVDTVGAFVNANPWVFVPKEDGSGWYAATWEWLRFGQTSKARSSVAGDHIKKNPLREWLPVPGETYGFMVSGLARDRKRNVYERSNVYMLVWE